MMWPWKERIERSPDVWEAAVEDQQPDLWHVWRVHFPTMVLTYDLVQDGERIQSLEYRCRRSEAGAWEYQLTDDSVKILQRQYDETLRVDPRGALREHRPASAHLLGRLRQSEVAAAEEGQEALEKGPVWERFDPPRHPSLERAFEMYLAR
jgi:hypothetical protein